MRRKYWLRRLWLETKKEHPHCATSSDYLRLVKHNTRTYPVGTWRQNVKRRRSNVVLTSCAGWVVALRRAVRTGLKCWRYYRISSKVEMFIPKKNSKTGHLRNLMPEKFQNMLWWMKMLKDLQFLFLEVLLLYKMNF